MTQAERERDVADATCESIDTIRGRSFSPLDIHDRRPQIVNWDALDAQRTALFPQRGESRSRALAGGGR